MNGQSFDFRDAFSDAIEIQNLIYFLGRSLEDVSDLSQRARLDDIGSMQMLCYELKAIIEPLEGLQGIIATRAQGLAKKLDEGGSRG